MIDSAKVAPTTPVLVGIGVATQREEDWRRAREPLELMQTAVQVAGRDAGHPALLAGTEYVAVPQGRWSYRNPAGAVARALGATRAMTVLANVGVLQQTLIGEACARIARGETEVALITGADAGYRLLRAQIAGDQATETPQNEEPQLSLTPAEDLFHPVESRLGLEVPVSLYAIMESAFRARQGWSVDTHRTRLAELYARFCAVAADNPHAWQRERIAANTIRDAAPRNPLQAFPYTRAHCSTWNVDQAAALLFCSAARATELRIPRERWVFPLASTESNHMLPVSARADISTCPGARLTGAAALDAGDVTAQEVDLVELYSCFPIAVETYAEALGLDLATAHTFTGGMPFAGGPFNNYVLQCVCRAAELLRAGHGRQALISSVSGLLTKQAFGLWSCAPGPRGFVNSDLTAAVARESPAVDVVDGFTGTATIVGHTVLYGRGQSPRGVALVDTADQRRTFAATDDPQLIAALEADEWVGRRVSMRDNRLLGSLPA